MRYYIIIMCTQECYATICITLRLEDVPREFLKRVLSISASKLGSGDVSLASHMMVVLNVRFNGRAGRLAPDVLLVKSPEVLVVSRAGEAKASGYR